MRHGELRHRSAMHSSIDDIDAQLLRLLQSDGRMSKQKLADAVGLSAAATHDRVRRLTDDGYILGYEAVLNPLKLCAGLLVFAEVRLEYTGVGVADAFRAAVQVRPEILECYEVAGSFDYMIKTRVADMGAYRDLVASVVWTLPGVRDLRTFAVMEEIKNTARIPL
jgi:Lrp/AsnC family transcriptional regulator, leucine-responsive regulatory protein